MEFSQISVGLAFLAGLASFLSPCVFSLVPAYVGYLGGRAAGGESNSKNRWITFSHGLAFVLGFSTVFVLLGVAAAFAGGLLYELRFWLAKIGGIVVIVFGLHMIGVFHLSFLAYDTRVPEDGLFLFCVDGCVLLGGLVSLCWTCAWCNPYSGVKWRLDFTRRCIAHVLFHRPWNSVPGRCTGHRLGDKYFAELCQDHALRGNCHGRDSCYYRCHAFHRCIRIDRAAGTVLLLRFWTLISIHS